MKAACLITCFLLYATISGAQSLSLPDLLNLTSSSTERFLHAVGKKGYRPVSSSKHIVKVFHPKDTIAERYLVKQMHNQYTNLQLQKLTADEYTAFKQRVLAEGFQQGTTSEKVFTELFEKKETTITAAAEIDLEEGKRWYNVVIERRNLPRLKELSYAEDLLAFNSHTQLVQVFGNTHVVKDKYHVPDGATINCSVVYPNSSREAVFLWKDAENRRDLLCIRVGGNMNTSSAMQFSSQIAQNSWSSRQGVYATMTLNQLQTRNQNSVKFFGWGGGATGNLCPGNEGQLDFARMSLELSCMNCHDDVYYGKTPHSSDKAIADSRRIYVTTMIFYPEAVTSE